MFEFMATMMIFLRDVVVMTLSGPNRHQNVGGTTVRVGRATTVPVALYTIGQEGHATTDQAVLVTTAREAVVIVPPPADSEFNNAFQPTSMPPLRVVRAAAERGC